MYEDYRLVIEKNDMKAVICAIAKNENAYLYEWASYHLRFGFSDIYLYDNNDVDGERIENVFKGADIEQRVHIIDRRGEKYIQKQVYQDFYEKGDFDWCAFIDIDEFITFENPQMTVEQFLKDKFAFDAIHLNWMCYGDSGFVTKEDRPVQERFIKPWSKNTKYNYINRIENEHIKSIIRKGLKVDWVNGENSNPHTPKGLNCVGNAKGELVANEPFAPICHEVCYIRHYITKTIEEYATKINRQCADCSAVVYSYNKFFRVNAISCSKMRWLKRNYPQVSLHGCIIERIKFIIVNYGLPFRFMFRSLSKRE